MSAILGINAFHAAASACLVIDGVPVFALAEERVNRVKYFGGFPIEAVKLCLAHAGIKITDIDHVAVGRDPDANKFQKLKYVATNLDAAANLAKIRGKSRKFSSIKEIFVAEFDVPEDKLKFQTHNVEHHVAHVASAYFISPWDKAASFTLDGSGDFVTSTLARCEGSNIEVLKKTFVPNSAGSLYTMISEFIGYPYYGDEGKVMGLAPYGEDSYRKLFEDIVHIENDSFRLNQKYFMKFGSNAGISMDDKGQMSVHRHYSDHMVELLGPVRPRDQELSQRDKDLAFGCQHRFEDIYMAMLNALHKRVPNDRVVIAGGCALNSVANGKLFDQTPFRETVIQPAAGDDGLAMGAALYVSNSVLKEGNRWTMVDSYMGSEFSDTQIKAALDRLGVVYHHLGKDALVEAVADRLVKGEVMGWFQGREEWGPRALGNRSILVHPGYPDMKDILNSRIKRREWYRPFAPAVLAERQNDIFEKSHPSPFMLHVYKIKPAWRDKLSAVNHSDDTGRLQTVTKAENPLYHQLITAFDKRTGIPVLINTSFNENEPIVHSPDEAIECFLRTKMDILGIGGFLAVKSEQKQQN